MWSIQFDAIKVEKKLLNKLKEIAIRFHIDPQNTIAHAAKLETIISVLSYLNKSYKSYLEIEFKKTAEFTEIYRKNEDTLNTLIKELDLLAVDLQFGSLDISVAPNVLDDELIPKLFSDNVSDWKRSSFENYKKLVSSNFDEFNTLKGISDRYSEEERRSIFRPLFSSIGTSSDYKLSIKSRDGKIIKRLVKPDKDKLAIYLPKKETKREKPKEKVVLIYAKLNDRGEADLQLSKKTIKEVLHLEELEHSTYPYSPDFIQFEGKAFYLNEALKCTVSFEDEQYFIRNEKLDLTVWGDTREEAEEAFSFSFYSLVQNFYNEDDSKLSKSAQELKTGLKNIIKQVADEG